jgi:putative transposase
LVGGIIPGVPRLRRLVLSHLYFFITCRLLPPRRLLAEADFECHARVIAERRTEHRFVLTAWVLLPDHWHAIFFPASPLTIALVMECIKVSSTFRINAARRERGKLWQPRYYDRVLRTVKEYREKVDYIHQNPVRARLVRRAEDWLWSSAREYSGTLQAPASVHPILSIDRVVLPSDEQTRI